MFQEAQSEIEEIRRLVLTPTPQNFQTVNTKLESLAGSLSQMMATYTEGTLENPGSRDFLLRLPAEIARIRTLMEAPSVYYRSLENLCAMYFGSYERSGSMRSLQPAPATRTLAHL
jgi:hypothetical protein